MKTNEGPTTTVLILSVLVLFYNGCVGASTTIQPSTQEISSKKFSASITIQATVSNQTTLTTDMMLALTAIFNGTSGFIQVDVIDVRQGSIVSDFNIVVSSSRSKEAQVDIAKVMLELLSRSTNVTYAGSQHTVDELSVNDSTGQNTSFKSVADICAIFVSMDPCHSGTCVDVGGEPTCINVTTTTDFTSSVTEPPSTEPPTQSTEPPTTPTEPPSTSTEQPMSTTDVTNTSTEPSTITSTEPSSTSTEPPMSTTNVTITSTEPSTTSTEPPTSTTNLTTTLTEQTTTSTEPPTTSTEPPPTPTEPPTTSTVQLTTSTGPPTTSTEPPSTSTEPPTTSTEPPTTPTEPPTTSTVPPTTSTEPPTTPTEPPTTSTEPPTTSTNPPTTPTEPPTTSTEPPTTPTEPPTTSTEPSTTSTEPPTTPTEPPTTSTEPPTTPTEPPTTPTEPPTTSTVPPTTSTEPPTTQTEPPTTPTEPPTTSTEPPTTPTEPPTTSTEPPTTPTEPPTTPTEPPTTSTVPPTTSTETPTTSTEPPTISTIPPTTSTGPPTTSTELPTTSVEIPTSTNEPESSFAASISINATIANTTTINEDMKTALTSIFNGTRGFQRLVVTKVRAGSIVVDFRIVVVAQGTSDAQTDIAKTMVQLLLGTLTISYYGQLSAVLTINVLDSTGQNTSLTSADDVCAIFTSLNPCQFGNCSVVGGEPSCLNGTADMTTTPTELPSSSTELQTSTTTLLTSSTEPQTISTEPPTTSTGPPTTSTVPPTTSTEPPTTATERPTTSTEPPTTSTEPTTISTEPPTTSTVPPTTSTEPPTKATERPTTSTEPPTTSTEPTTISTEPPTTSTEPPTTSTEPPTTSTERPTTSTEPPTTSTVQLTTSTGPPTTPTEPPTTSTVPPTTALPTTSTEPPTTSTAPPSTPVEPSITSTEPPSTSTEPPTTSTEQQTTPTEPPTTSTVPPTTSTEPPTTSTAPPTTSTEPPTTSKEPPSSSTELQTSTTTLPTSSTEPQTTSTELSTTSTEQPTTSTEPSTTSTEPPTTSTEPQTTPTEPPTTSTVQLTTSTEPPTTSTEPTTISTEPPTTSTEPPTTSTVPPTTSTEPPTTSTERPTTSTEPPTTSTVQLTTSTGPPTTPTEPPTTSTVPPTTALPTTSTEPPTTSTAPPSTPVEPSITSTEPPSTSTEPPTTSTEQQTTPTEPPTTSTVPPTTSTEPPTTSTAPPTTSTEPPTTSKEPPSSSTELQTSTTTLPTSSTEPQTTSTELSTTSTEQPTTSTEPSTTSTEPPTTSTEPQTTPTEPPTTSTVQLTTSTEPPTTSTEPPTTPTEPPTTSTVQLTTSTGPPTTSTEPPITSTVPPTTSTEPSTTSTESPTTSTEPPTTSTVPSTTSTELPTTSIEIPTSTNEPESSFAASISINATIANTTTINEDMKAALTPIFNGTRGFQRLVVTGVRAGSIVVDFRIVVVAQGTSDAQTDIAKTMAQLLSGSSTITYNGQATTVIVIIVIDTLGQNKNLTNADDVCVIFTALKPCEFGNCSVEGGEPICRNLTTDMTTSSTELPTSTTEPLTSTTELPSSTTEPSTTSTEPPTSTTDVTITPTELPTTTTEPPNTTTEIPTTSTVPQTTSTVPPTTSTEPSTTSTEQPTDVTITSTELPTTSTEPSITTSTEPSTTSTEPSITTSTEPSTTSTEPSTTSIEPSTTSTEPSTTSTEPSTTTTEIPTTSTIPQTTSTEPSTTSTEPSTTSTEPSTTSTEPSTTSTEPSTTSTEPSTTSTEPSTTSTEPSTTSTEPSTTSTEPSTTSTELPTTTTQDTTTTNVQTTTVRVPAINEPLEFGTMHGDTSMTGDDISSPALESSTGIYIGDGSQGMFTRLYIGTNGIISLQERFNRFSALEIESSELVPHKVICPYWVDLMSFGTDSAVFYNLYKRENAKDSDVLQRADKIIQTSFSDFPSFKSSIVFKATWNNMAFYMDTTKRVTFQTLVVSDGKNTFSVTYYINVDVTAMASTNITVGYRYGIFNEKNAYSWQNAAFRLSSVPGNTGYTGFWVSKLTTDDIVFNPLELECYNWYASQSLYSRPRVWMRCPCSGNLMRFQGFRFAVYRLDTVNKVICYVSLTFGSSLECCYSYFNSRWGRIIPGSLSRRMPAAGSVLSANPFFQPRSYYENDQRPKEVCCASGHCDWYYALRPTPFSCNRFIRTRIAWFFGDPHITTLDGGEYTFNGYGEYTMMKIDHNGTRFDFQARTDLATTANGTTINATIFSAFVAKDHTGSTMQVEMSRNRDKMYVYGNGRDLTTNLESEENYVFRTVNMTISKENETIVTSFVNSAITIKISLGVRFLTSETMVDAEYNGRVVGLMGNFDGNSTNDFILPNGTTLANEDVKTERQIYENFGQLWSVNSTTSLFQYSVGLSHANYSHPEFVPFYIDEEPEDKVNKSREVCGGAKATQACIFDYLATGDKTLADSSGNSAETSVSDRENLENEAPQITGDSQINAEVNRSVEIKFNATDDGQFTYKILQEPPGFDFDNTTGKATWIPQDNNVTNIRVTVVDDKGAEASPLDVNIILCSGCNDNGICAFNNTRTSSNELFKYAECICNTGYSGQDCENDTDACAETPCALGRTCADLTPIEEVNFGRGYNCSDCPGGFKEVDEKCEDINECNSTSLHNCNSETEICENTEGSFVCNCRPGFRKTGSTCQDIDECTESTSGCQQLCNNTLGSFTCSCITGYTLENDNKTCNGTSSCPDCEYACNNNDANNPVCICKNGYQLEDNGKNCTDVDECALTGVCSQKCDNSIGSYLCSCFAGFSLNEDKTTCAACELPKYGDNCNQTCNCGKGMDRCDSVTGCVCKTGWMGNNCDKDIDECVENPTICGSDKICQNLEGSHVCNCREGFQKDGSNCVDIDECASVLQNNCTALTSNCSNQDGGFTCSCKTGYRQKNLFECEDFDECQAKVDGCSQKCKNVDGGFNCECEFGYSLDDDRKTCLKVQDVCSLFPNLNCSYGCNTNGSHGFCFCPAGYQLNAQDQRTCIDVDECNNDALNQCSNPNLCVNMDGSYKCTCPDYSTLANDGRTCKECDGFHFGKNCENSCNCGIGSSRCDKEKGCVCKTGWTGAQCDLDVDECAATSPCTGNNQVCQNSPGSYKCICEKGYKEDAGICKDIDECDASPCSQICINTNGGYSCSCNNGFRLKGTSECEDYDECSAPVSPCDQKCTNTLGSFKCFCNEGFLLNTTTRKSCNAKTECSNNTTCDQNCGVKPGGIEYCFCTTGYSLNVDNTTCFDIDECSTNPCTENCTQNTAGQGYTCSCAIGKKLDVDERTCIECENGTYGDSCSANCTCNAQTTDICDKVTGNCTCKSGWTGEDCSVDIDECTNTTLCPEFSTCENKNGSYSCNCDSGYSLASGKCVECTLNRYGENCAHQCLCELANTQSCDKVTGNCTCKDGWQGANCTEDVPECSNTAICGPNAECSETRGSYICNCIEGYKKNSTGSCIDIDECSLGTDNCHANADCQNTEGNFTCKCKVGFSGNGYSCTPCNNTYYGDMCASPCTCVEENTEDCNDVTGKCNCKSTWTGGNCDVDVNECNQGTDNCTAVQVCHNIVDGWNCSCRYGENGTGGGCNDQTTTTSSPDSTTGYSDQSTTGISTQSTEGTFQSTQSTTQSPESSFQSSQTSAENTGSTSQSTQPTDTSTQTTQSTVVDIESSSQSTQPSSQSTLESTDSTTRAGCNSTHYGLNCNNLCNCVANNTVDCHDDNGTCTCKEGWTSDTCGTDINECTSNKHNCNATTQQCENKDGGFTCVCLYGNSNTGCIVKEKPYVPESTEVKLGLTVTFAESINLANYDDATDKMTRTLTDYYKGKIPGFVKVVILVIRLGSTIVEHEIITNKTEDSDVKQIELVGQLLGEKTLVYDGKNLTTSQISMTDKNGNPIVVTNTSSKCERYVIIHPCDQGEKCVEENSNVYCTGIVDEYDDFKLIVGLGVGLSVFFLTVLVVIIIVVYIRRRHRKEGSLSSDDNFVDTFGGQGLYFSSGIPTKIDSWGRHGYPLSPHLWGGNDVKRGRDGFEDVTSAREPYTYDNGVQSNFSWDFMYQALQPNEKFQIKRPEVSSKPLNTK